VALRATYTGDASSARKAWQPLWLETPVSDTFAEVAYSQASVPGTAPRNFDLFTTMPDIDTIIRVAKQSNALELRYWGGAIARSTSPAGHRDVPFSITLDGPETAAEQLWPHATGGSFLNFLHDPDAVETAYTATDYQQLREIKADHDPANLFHRNLNIPPA
jgi:hypothetical protein